MRIKMYKSGKAWVTTALLITGSVAALQMNQPVSADNNETTNTVVTTTHPENGFQTVNGKQYYYENNQLVTNTQKNIDGKIYDLAADGEATIKNGLVKISDQDGYAFYKDGVRVTNQFVTVDNNTYYFGQYGESYSGLHTIGTDEYYFGDDHSFTLRRSIDSITINNVPYKIDSEGRLTAIHGILWGFGDSTTVGWNPYNDGSRSYDYYAAQALQMLYKNTSAYSGTQIGQDMVWMTDQAVSDPSFTKATDIVIALGVNDSNYGIQNINTIAQIFQDSVRRLHQANPNIKIHILLPQGDFLNGRNNDTINGDGFSMNQLKSVLTMIGNNMGVNVIDAGVVTDQNHNETIPDGVHPTNAAYKAIAAKIADAIQNDHQQYRDNAQHYDLGNVSGYVNTLAGWRWLENGKAYTGFRYYMGTYYWFVNGVRQNRGWHEAWGRLYYTDDNGRAVQGIYNINGQNFDFGNDGSYYLRSSGYLYDGSSQNGGYRWYEDGKLFTGFRYYMGTFYWFVDGVRQNAGWRQAWGMTYYTDASGRAVQGIQTIDGKAYNFGTDNTYYERPVSGYIHDGSSQNGGYRWYENGNLFTGFRFYMGTYYWFIDGVRQNAGWREAWGMKYYTDANGRAVQGDQTIDGRHYFFGNDGSYYLR
ncbi:GDSL-type esterase/lipase family protein [Fructobacillus durionis]|uniref:KxYKxGKxW signal peptide containing protein n=1 Tax=Fructobacillus durionis TaxID=283737 RepID=A0A1I1E319_9LACO|nr:GDSL-type esterase/lipase family protein [Fructobacillus durionis]SFB81062.1 KxYKxGKxW signal peptide containing protein [Fructobacillus durionis]